MKARKLAIPVVLLLLSAELAALATGTPYVGITSPSSGATLLSHAVNITGTALGSAVDWQQTSQEDFAAGARENLTLDPAGTLYLDRSRYDDFNDNSLDPGRWQKGEANGPTVTEAGGQLVMSGSGSAAGCWTSYCQVISVNPTSNVVDGSLVLFSEFGTGAYTGIGLYQDDNNYILLGRVFDFFGLGPGQRILLAYSVGGLFTMRSLGAIPAGPHAFNLSLEGGTAYLYMDGALQGTQAIALSNPRCLLRSAVNTTIDAVDARWDNVNCYYLAAGKYTSDAYDTLTDRPVFQSVMWTVNLPAGLSLEVQTRSADNPAMTGASAWTAVTNGQNASLPGLQRYLQYAALFSSPQGNDTPQLRDITLRYLCGVRTVEVSLDNRTTWQTADGKESWNITVDLPDGTRTIWARVTDVEGDLQMSSVKVEVDTTPPTGSISINEGAEMTPQREVTLALPAFDSYTVRSMLLSEKEDFQDAAWQDYSASLQWNLSPGDGLKTVFVKFRDANGWESGACNASITLDTQPPVGSLLIDGGAEFTKSPSVRLTLNATDAFGVTEMMIANTGGFEGANWIPFAPTIAWELEPGSGDRTVFARLRDPAGHESGAFNDTIALDSTIPEFYFSLNDGAVFATSTELTVRVNATDNYRVERMMFGANPNFQGAAWEQFSRTKALTISAVEGQHIIYAKVRDAAGNEAPPQSAAITLDSAAPLCVVSSLPPTVASLDFTVRWNAEDSVSGVAWMDVQYRDGAGPWVDWLTGVNITSSVFAGQDNHTYTFRSRAQDHAGNLGLFPADPKNSVTVRLPGPGSLLPEAGFGSPAANSTLGGNAVVSGTARAGASGRNVTLVQVQIDDGPWQNATGTAAWSFAWDTSNASNGRHTLRVRAYDGLGYSQPVERSFLVQNEKAGEKAADSTLLFAAVVLIAALAGVGAFLLLRRRKPAQSPGPSAPAGPTRIATPAATEIAQSSLPAAGEPAAAAPAGGAAPAEGKAASSVQAAGAAPKAAAVSPETGPAPAVGASPAPPGTEPGVPAETPSASTEGQPSAPPLSQEPEGPSPEEKARVLATVRALHPTLPPELRYHQPDELALMVVTGERGKSPQGQTLVLIMGRWYLGDENRPNFLQRFEW